MKRSPMTRRTALRTLATTALGAGAIGTASAHKGGLKGELADVRSATAAYNDVANAEADGYVQGHAVCGMGYHFANFGLVGAVDRTKPQALVYGEDDDGNLVLGAVEYIVPKAGPYADSPPDLFAHDGGDEEWDVLETPEFEAWTLHVWVHNHNPDGVFAPFNPRELFCPDGAGHH